MAAHTPAAWRFRRVDFPAGSGGTGPWNPADKLRDAHDVIGDTAAQIQKRTGTRRTGYRYVDHSTIAAHEYDVEGYYAHGWERVCTESDKVEAKARLSEYNDAEPGVAHRIRRVKADA